MKRSRLKELVIENLRQTRGKLALAGLCMFGFIATQLLMPWPLKVVFDHIILEKPPPPALSALAGLEGREKVTALVVVSAFIVVLAVLRGLFSYYQFILTSTVGHRIVYTLRRELFAHLQRLSLSFHNRNRSGELLSRMAGDTNVLREVFAGSGLQLGGDVITVFGMLGIMLWLDWRLGLIVLATFPILLGTFFYRYRTVRSSVRRQRRKEGKIASQVNEVLGAVPLVQAFGREGYEAERFDTQSAATLDEGIRTAKLEAAAARAVDITRAIGTAAILLFGSLEVLAGRMTLGTVLVFASYLSHLYRPIRNLTKLSKTFARASVSADRIAEILEAEPEIRDDPNAIEASGLAGAIAFENVSFDYGDGRKVLDDVSFSVTPGHRVALVGASGAGKSTLVALVLRFYDPTSGSISIDGVDLRRYRCASLRREIGIVLQDSLLFGTTIGENIAYGKPGATDEDIVAAARAANAHEFISRLENGYETVVGERGATLSGGERRRIGIARALIRNAPILILDEPMSGLDVESEGKVREALAHLMAGKTCILITHDLPAASDADQIVILESGRVVERGDHDELMARSPLYRRLLEMKRGPRPLPRVLESTR
jgi:ABC-type multidrug transport system fused ATPase/permease subunit